MDTYDSEAGAMAPAVAFRSRDNGLTWAPLARDLGSVILFAFRGGDLGSVILFAFRGGLG